MNQNLIYDIGMNTGDDTAYYLHRGYRRRDRGEPRIGRNSQGAFS